MSQKIFCICIVSFPLQKEMKIQRRSECKEPQTDFIGFKSFIKIFCGIKRSTESILTFPLDLTAILVFVQNVVLKINILLLLLLGIK